MPNKKTAVSGNFRKLPFGFCEALFFQLEVDVCQVDGSAFKDERENVFSFAEFDVDVRV